MHTPKSTKEGFNKKNVNAVNVLPEEKWSPDLADLE